MKKYLEPLYWGTLCLVGFLGLVGGMSYLIVMFGLWKLEQKLKLYVAAVREVGATPETIEALIDAAGKALQ